MKLKVESWLTFLSHPNDYDKPKMLVSPQSLSRILGLYDGKEKTKYLKQGYQSAVLVRLHFSSLAFRKQYYQLIYAAYSDASQNVIQNNERLTLLRWAKAFNHSYKDLKILKIEPLVSNHKYEAVLSILGINSVNNHWVFDVKSALFNEFRQKGPQALIRLEVNENRHLTEIMQQMFERCAPDAGIKLAADLNPARFHKIHTERMKSLAIESSASRAQAVSRSASLVSVSKATSLSKANSLQASYSTSASNSAEAVKASEAESSRSVAESIYRSKKVANSKASVVAKSKAVSQRASASNASSLSSERTVRSTSVRAFFESQSVARSKAQNSYRQSIIDVSRSKSASLQSAKSTRASLSSQSAAQSAYLAQESKANGVQRYRRNRAYIPMVIIISAIIIILLIWVLPLFHI